MARSTEPSTALPLGLAAGAGVLMPLQALITSSAAAVLGSFQLAALLSSGTALVLMFAASMVLKPARAGWKRVGTVWRERSIPRWYLVAGLIGAYYILAQALSVGSIGLALFAVAVVGARTLSSILIDMVGFSPAGRQPVTPRRIIGAIVLCIGASIAALGTGERAQVHPGAWWGFAAAVLAGLLVSFQQSMNGHSGRAYASTTVATTLNYITGVIGLGVLIIVTALLNPTLPVVTGAPEYWMLLAGPLGILFVVTGVSLVPKLGSLVLGIALVTGQLVGSLLMDLVIAPATVGPAEVIGTLVTLCAVVFASWQPRPRSRPTPKAPPNHA